MIEPLSKSSYCFDTMTISTLTPSSGTGPYYVRLADGIEAAVADGTLAEGARLPPQRNLAFDLGVTVGTVSRAYALLRERGLVSGEVGRGTYVQARRVPARAAMANVPEDLGGTRFRDVPPGKQRFDTTAAPLLGQSQVIGEVLAGVVRDHPQSIASYSRTTHLSWCEAGQIWLSRNGWRPERGDVIATFGAHAGALSAIAAVTSPGDRIAFEALSYSQLARGVRLIGRRIVAVDVDAQGMLPDDFERLCAQQRPKLAYLMPTLHNPTLGILPEDRRREIARIAAQYDVWLIEDDIYGSMSDDPTPMLADFAPERTFVVNGLSKAVAAGLRGGWIACPPHLADRVKIAHKLTTGGLSFLLAETAARMVLSGVATAIKAETLAELTARHAILQAELAGHQFAASPAAPYVWLKLPGSWLSGTFKAAALHEDLLVDDEDEFKPVRMDRAFHRIRISFSSGNRAELALGLARLRRLLDSNDSGYASEV